MIERGARGVDGHTAGRRVITEKGAVLFVELARKPSSDVAALAASIGESTRDTRALLTELLDLGLITQDEPGAPWKPVDPVTPLRKLITDAERDVSSARSRREELSNLEDRLSRAYGFHVERDAEDRAIEVIHGVREANERLWQLSQLEDTKALSMWHGVPLMDGTLLEEAIHQEMALSERILDNRLIIDHARITGPTDPLVNALARAGQDIRVARMVPMRCVVHSEWAALPLTRDDDGSGGVMIVHASSMVLALESLFECVWKFAQPLGLDSHDGATIPSTESVIDQDAEHLLSLLATGIPDEAIARHLKTSPRTVRRRIKDLSDQLGAGSRFQLALAATTNGWRAMAASDEQGGSRS